MRRFHRPAAFDLALNLFSSFGYFTDAEENLQVLRNLPSLTPAGGAVGDGGQRTAGPRFPAPLWHRHAARDEYLLEERIVREGWSVIENHWIWMRGPEQKCILDYSPLLWGGTDGSPLQRGLLRGPALWEPGRYPI